MASEANRGRPDGYTVEYRQGGGFRRLIAELLGEPPRAIWSPPPYAMPAPPAQGPADAAVAVPPAAPPVMSAPPAPMAIDRLGLAWRGRFWILLAAVVGGIGAYVGCSLLPPTYQSTATLRVMVHSGSGMTQDAVLASNDLAGQYAPLMRTSAVIDPAAARLGMSGGALASAVTSAGSGDQNLMSISAQAGTQREAQRRANAVARQFVTYLRATNRQQIAAYTKGISTTLAPIQAEIAQLQAQLGRGAGSAATSTSGTSANAAQATLATLLTTRQQAAADIAQRVASSQPQIDLIGQAGAGAQVQPKPMLYAIVTALAAFLLTLQLVVVVGARRLVAAAT